MASVVALGSGLVGQFVIERLLEADHKVIVIDLQIPEALHQHPRVEARQGDAIQAVSRLPPNKRSSTCSPDALATWCDLLY